MKSFDYMPIMPGMTAAEEAAVEARRRRAFVHARGGDLGAIRHYHAGGMSKRRLEEIYGRELVHRALQG